MDTVKLVKSKFLYESRVIFVLAERDCGQQIQNVSPARASDIINIRVVNCRSNKIARSDSKVRVKRHFSDSVEVFHSLVLSIF